MSFSKCEILNIQFDNITQAELLDHLDEGVVITPNIDHLMKLQRDRSFYSYCQNADFTVCDSRIIYLLSKVLFPKRALRDHITGSDLFPAFCDFHKENPSIKIFLLGGTEVSVQQARQKINDRIKSTIICGAYSPPFGFENDQVENGKIVKLINESKATVLAIGVGAPKQEKWIFENRSSLTEVNIFFAIGATIEFEAGNLKRAPKWMTKSGLEWLYRLLQEPRRLAKRYLLEDLPFFVLIIKQKLGIYQNPWT